MVKDQVSTRLLDERTAQAGYPGCAVRLFYHLDGEVSGHIDAVPGLPSGVPDMMIAPGKPACWWAGTDAQVVHGAAAVIYRLCDRSVVQTVDFGGRKSALRGEPFTIRLPDMPTEMAS